MTPLGWLALASATFVSTHFLLSHPLRAATVARFGEKGFALPDMFAFVGGTILWLVATFAHGYMPAGIWHWFA